MFDEDGYAIFGGLLSADQCQAIAQRISESERPRASTRNLLHDLICVKVATDLRSSVAIAEQLGVAAVAVQCTLFDKSSERNWLVAWHQDLSIPVAERVLHPECTGWSQKEGALFVQPPVSILESLVAIRVHLDDCTAGAGPLRVVPGSHRHGRLSRREARRQRETNGEVPCLAKRGDALLMRPLLLHASSKATAPSRRRVLHFLFGPAKLPYGLRWANAV